MPTELAIGALVLLLLIAVVGWWSASTRVGRHNRARQRRAVRGEAEAESLLADLGFTVLDRQVTRPWHLEVDGEEAEVRSRADLLVEDGAGRRWIAEVKTGERAPDPTRPATRRQLLEYRLVFDVEGVLLVDADAGEVHEIRFPGLI